MSNLDGHRVIDQTQNELEQRLLEVIRRLELGREEALEELRGSRESLPDSAGEMARVIDSRTDEVRDEFKEAQKHLGRLNFMLAEDDLGENVEISHTITGGNSVVRLCGARGP